MTLISHWKLDGNADDSIGQNHGTLSGAPSATDGKIGQCYYFDGENGDYMQIPNSTLQGLSNYTISFWAKGQGETGRYIFSVAVPGNNNYMLMRAPSDSIWHFFVWRRNSDGTHIYEDLVQTDSYIYSNPEDPIDVTDGAIVLVQEQDSVLGGFDSSQAFNGKIDDVRIYNHALSTKEVKELYRAKVLHYKMNKTIISGLIYKWYDTQTWYSNNSHPTTESELDEFFDDSNSGVSFGDDGLFEKEIYWGSSSQTGPDGTVNDKPSYLPGDGYSWKVEGFIYASETGTYTIGVDGDDACDVIIDGQLTANYYSGHGFSGSWTGGTDHNTGTIDLVSGNYYSFVARMEEGGGGDGIAVGWQKPSDSSILTIPSRYFYYKPINDSSGYGNHGTIYGATFSTNSKIGSGCYEFDGVDDYIDCGNNSEFNFDLGNFTVGFWAKRDPSNPLDTNIRILDKSGGIPSTPGPGYVLWNRNNTIIFEIGNGTSKSSVSYVISDFESSFHHVMGIRDGNILRIIVDGIERDTADITEFGSISNTYDLVIGARSSKNMFWSGLIDDVRIYATALTEQEIEELYQQRASLDNDGNFYSQEFQENDNLAPNPSFENGTEGEMPDGWSLDSGTCFITGGDYHSGSKSIYFPGDGDYHRIRQTEPFPVYPGEKIYGRNWSKTESGALHYFGVDWDDGTYDYFHRPQETEWTESNSSYVVAPSGATYGQTWIFNYRDNTGALWVDDVYVTRNGPIPDGFHSRLYYLSSNLLYNNINKKGQFTYNCINEVCPTEGLVGWWSLDGHMRDISVNRNDGTTTDAPSAVAGIDGQMAYEFNGVDDYIEVPDDNNLDGMSEFTISLWVYHTSISGDHDIIAKGKHTSYEPFVLWRDTGNTAYAVLITDNNGNYSGVFYTSTSTPLEDWTHIIVTFIGKDKVSIYINSQEDANSPFSITDVNELAETSDNLYIGDSGNHNYPFDGKIQDVRIYNRALSAEEINILYSLTGGSDINKMKQTQNKLYIKNQFKEV